MTRVLLVTERSADFESQSIASQLLSARDAGFACERIELPPAGATPAAIRRILWRNAQREFDVLHAFGPRALLALAAVGCQPIIYSPPSDEPTRRAARLRWIGRFRQIAVACTSLAGCRQMAASGIAAQQCRVIPPPVGVIANGQLSRQQLGLRDEDRVLLAVGESTHASRHRLAIWTAVILHFLDRRYRLLLWGRGPQAEQAHRFAAALKQPDLCVFAEQRAGHPVHWSDVANLADLAIFTAVCASAILPGAICQLLNIPVVDAGGTGSIGAEFTNCGRAGLQSQSRRPREIARQIHHWLANREQIGQVARAAREYAANRYSATAVGAAWSRLYEDAVVGRRAVMPVGDRC